MKRMLQLTMAGVVVCTAMAMAATAPDINDQVLVMYKLSAQQEAQFNGTDGQLSGFWAQWDALNAGGLTRDYIEMRSDITAVAWSRCATSPFAGADDAQLLIRAAYGANGAYFYCAVVDNQWVEPADWGTDMTDLYIDLFNTSNGLGDPLNYFNTGWSITPSTRQIQVSVGSSTPLSTFNYRYYEELQVDIIDHTVALGDATVDGMTMDLITTDATHRTQEWFIPWAVWGITSQVEGAQYGFTGGYNDTDNDAMGCPNSLRWSGLCDPYCAADVSVWGNAQLGPTVGVLPRGTLRNAGIAKHSVVKKTDFYTVRGEKISNPSMIRTANLVVKRDVLGNGKVNSAMVSVVR